MQSEALNHGRKQENEGKKDSSFRNSNVSGLNDLIYCNKCKEKIDACNNDWKTIKRFLSSQYNVLIASLNELHAGSTGLWRERMGLAL